MGLKPLCFMGSSREDLKEFPRAVMKTIGNALFEAQMGEKPVEAKPFKGFGGAGVLEVIENYCGGAYRAVYTVKFKNAVYVLHCFQKKSKVAIQTPRYEMFLIRQRLRMAEAEYKGGEHG